MSERIRRRDVLAVLSTVGTIGIAGCSGSDNPSENNGGNNTGESTDTPTESTPTESEYDPQDYYGLPECDGSRPIRLIAVNSDGSGIIQNMRGDDQLVYVKHDDGITSGDYCGGTIVEGGEQTAYEVPYGGEPRQIEIGAVEATSRNKDAACSQSGALPDGDYTDGCVNPDTFQGFREVNNTPQDDENDVAEDVLEETGGVDSESETESEDTETPEQALTFANVSAELTEAHSPIPPVVEWSRTISNNRDKTMEINFEFVVENPDITVREERTREIEAGDNETARGIKMPLDEWEEHTNADSRDARAEEYRSMFEESNLFIEYNGESWNAEKSIDERTSYP